MSAFANEPAPFSVEQLTREIVEQASGLPLDQWDSKCHGISCAIAPLVGGKVRRGYWTGVVHPDSVFAGRPLFQHSWIELPDGSILDPTRHALAGNGRWPLWTGSDEEYDAAGCRFQGPAGNAPDVFDSAREEYFVLELGSVEYFLDILGGHSEGFYGDDYIEVSAEQAGWLAHLPLHREEKQGYLCVWFAGELFQALIDAGFKALIPLDRLALILPERVDSGESGPGGSFVY